MSLGPDKSKRIFESAPKLTGRLQPGAVVDGRYRVMSFLGKGGMCVVYKAEHLNLHRLVALKLLQGGSAATNQERLGRFQREAMALAGLKHPNIVEVFGCGLYEQHTYMALEFLEGQSLAEMLAQKPGHRLLKEQALLLFLQMCDALEHAHGKGLIHRDLKPSNVMICSGDRVKLIDFGISKLLIDSSKDLQALTQTGQLIGSVHYMSPEQCMAKQLDARSDIYSLGCLMYEALCGHPPFSGDTPISILAQHLNVSAADTAELKDAFGSVILSCLEKNPENRPQSAKQLRDLLIDPQTYRPVRVVRKRKRLKISKPLIASATISATITLVAGGYVYWHYQGVPAAKPAPAKPAVNQSAVDQPGQFVTYESAMEAGHQQIKLAGKTLQKETKDHLYRDAALDFETARRLASGADIQAMQNLADAYLAQDLYYRGDARLYPQVEQLTTRVLGLSKLDGTLAEYEAALELVRRTIEQPDQSRRIRMLRKANNVAMQVMSLVLSSTGHTQSALNWSHAHWKLLMKIGAGDGDTDQVAGTLAKAYYQLKRYAEALPWFEKEAELSHGYLNVWMSAKLDVGICCLALSQQKTGPPAAAMRRKAIAAFQELVDVHEKLSGECQTYRQQAKQSLEQLQP